MTAKGSPRTKPRSRAKPQPSVQEESVRDAPREAVQRQRVVIEDVQPRVDCGELSVKRCVGEDVVVEADVFADGHDAVACLLLHRGSDDREWTETPMELVVNDRWKGIFPVKRMGAYRFTILAWVDHFESWRRDLKKKADAGAVAAIDLLVGAGFVEEVIEHASDDSNDADLEQLRGFRKRFEKCAGQHDRLEEGVALAEDSTLGALMTRWSPRKFATQHERELVVEVDRERAGYSTWYEVFPRSCANEPGQHGTFRDLEARLPYIASMGFDVLYLPPIHPIGRTNRKGRNNAKVAEPGEVGSPWAIGDASAQVEGDGGHKSIHPELGAMKDFHHLIGAACEHGMEIALDIAFQCSPDHPYLKKHPEWFRHRPDGTLQYAENPPKKYEDIYPFDFETDARESLWRELHSVFVFWIEQGVKAFRVDNPHTKAFNFWQWCIREIRDHHPDVIFLSEAFTRPKVMKRLAKIGFTQSYTYFTWKNTSHDLREYFTELTQPPVCEYYRANVWPNTPDILNEYLQHGGRPAFLARLVLAATLAANYGIYGPAFELCEHVPRNPGSEEYLDSEKYQIRDRDLDHPDSLREFIALVNRIRRENRALRSDRSLRFHNTDNEQILCYSKATGDLSNIIVTTVNLDPHHTHSGLIELPLDEFEMDEDADYQVHDLLSGAHYIWRGRWNYIELNPHASPAHIFSLKRRVRSEREFEYFA